MTNQKCFNPIESFDMKFKFRTHKISQAYMTIYISLRIHKLTKLGYSVAIFFRRKNLEKVSLWFSLKSRHQKYLLSCMTLFGVSEKQYYNLSTGQINLTSRK